MKAFTAQRVCDNLEAQLKGMIERATESVDYVRDRTNRQMLCHFHMRNGYVVEGVAYLMGDNWTTVAKEVSRKDALKKVIVIMQYNLATELMLDADNHVGERR